MFGFVLGWAGLGLAGQDWAQTTIKFKETREWSGNRINDGSNVTIHIQTHNINKYNLLHISSPPPPPRSVPTQKPTNIIAKWRAGAALLEVSPRGCWFIMKALGPSWAELGSKRSKVGAKDSEY